MSRASRSHRSKISRRLFPPSYLSRVIRTNFLFGFETRNESRAIKSPANIQIIIMAMEDESCIESSAAIAASCWVEDGLVVGCVFGSKLGVLVIGLVVGSIMGSFVRPFVGFDVGSWVSVVRSLVGWCWILSWDRLKISLMTKNKIHI